MAAATSITKPKVSMYVAEWYHVVGACIKITTQLAADLPLLTQLLDDISRDYGCISQGCGKKFSNTAVEFCIVS